MFQKKSLRYFDFWIVLFMISLIIFGIFIISSATNVDAGTMNKNVLKQIIGFSCGIVLMILASFFNYELLKKLYIPIYIITILMLLVVLKIGQGGNNSDVARWIIIAGFKIQPSEFAKIFMIIGIARFLDKEKAKINNPLILLLILVLVGIPTYLIKKQPDLSTSLVLVCILTTAIFVAKISYKYIIGVVVLILPVLKFIHWNVYQPKPLFFKEYQVNRILSFLEPDKYTSSGSYQTLNAIQAIGSGKLNGKGLYNGTLNNFNYLSASHTDFIFSVVGEEFGFIGCSLLIAFLCFIVFRCIINAKNAPDLFGTIICTSVATLIAFQTFVHVGVNIGIVPNTGMPLPFVSYGISSLWTNMICIGLVLNVGMMRKSSFTRR